MGNQKTKSPSVFLLCFSTTKKEKIYNNHYKNHNNCYINDNDIDCYNDNDIMIAMMTIPTKRQLE